MSALRGAIDEALTEWTPVDFAKEIRVAIPERMKRRRSSRERVAESGLSARSPEKFAIF
jgi:hypothetical protein